MNRSRETPLGNAPIKRRATEGADAHHVAQAIEGRHCLGWIGLGERLVKQHRASFRAMLKDASRGGARELIGAHSSVFGTGACWPTSRTLYGVDGCSFAGCLHSSMGAMPEVSF